MLSSKRKGMALEAKILHDLLQCGCGVVVPWGDTEQYDLITEINHKLYKIQVKTSRSKDGGASFEFDCRRNRYLGGGKFGHINYHDDDIDYFATAHNGQSYLIPADECNASKTLRTSAAKNKQTSGTNYAAQYELEKMVKDIKERDADAGKRIP